MAFVGSQVDHYGSGKDGSLTPTAANTIINSYAKVTSINGKNLTLDNYTDSSKFTIGTLLLIHVAGYSGGGQFKNFGYWKASRITAIDGNIVTVRKNLNYLTGGDSKALVQAVTIPEYTTVTLNAGKSITCPNFDATNGRGGIVVFQCSEGLILNGGHINLNGKGLTVANKATHPFESDAKKTGCENYKRMEFTPLGCPDGAAVLLLKKLTCSDTSSRIGNINETGEARKLLRGTDELGGASMTIVAETIENFSPEIISRKPSASGGKGVSGCYIATESEIPCDEGLYAYDRISNPTRMSSVFKITSFGDGSQGERKDYTKQLNSYAQITKIDKTRKVFTINQRNDSGLAKIAEGALVMIRIDKKPGGGYYQNVGRFVITTVLQVNQDTVTVADSFDDLGNMTTAHYSFQMVAIPQFTNFSLAKINSATPKFENGRGGIVAIAVNDTCDLRGGQLLVEDKGGAAPLLERGLQWHSNAMIAEKLPIGEGNGSVFILANNLILDEKSRLGARWSGAGYGGAPTKNGDGASDTGWGDTSGNENVTGGKKNGTGASGGQFSKSVDGTKLTLNGGYNSNSALNTNTNFHANQGAHILVISNKITNMNIAPFSTGGQGGGNISSDAKSGTPADGGNGGCGYGGAGGCYYYPNGKDVWCAGGKGGFVGGGAGYWGEPTNPKRELAQLYGGGSGAFCFIYCNQVENYDTNFINID